MTWIPAPEHRVWCFPRRVFATQRQKEVRRMLAAIGLGLIGTVLLIVLVIAVIMFFVRRA